MRIQTGLFLLLLVIATRFTSALAQEPADVLANLEGAWVGDGQLLGRPAVFQMRWSMDGRGAARLSFSNAWVNETGSVPVLSAEAAYLVDGGAVTGVWHDDRPQHLTLRGSITDSSLVIHWRAPAEEGRTEYAVRASGAIAVRDHVLSSGSERLFAEAVYRRQSAESRVTIPSNGWELIGDLRLPEAAPAAPAALLLHRAAGERGEYESMAGLLADLGIASLRLDLRGHGESTNLGRFEPGGDGPSPLIWDAEADVTAALAYLQGLETIDSERIAVVGASYTGEEMAEAARIGHYQAAYVALSPGSFSEASIDGIDSSRVPWLLVVSRDERYLTEITQSVQLRSQRAEVLVLPGSAHATRLLDVHPGLTGRIVAWLASKLEG